jgi:hypothetical protein
MLASFMAQAPQQERPESFWFKVSLTKEKQKFPLAEIKKGVKTRKENSAGILPYLCWEE